MSLLDKAKNITFVLVICLIWVTLVSRFLQWLTNTTWLDMHVTNIPYYLIFSCILAPIFEELFFRFIPLEMHRLVTKNSSQAVQLKSQWLVVLFTSLLFGWAHRNGFTSILIQGVCGLGFAYVYIRNGYSYISSVLLHSFWNLTCLFYNF
jgi:membrane protease YdiL (CAAX protease family)